MANYPGFATPARAHAIVPEMRRRSFNGWGDCEGAFQVETPAQPTAICRFLAYERVG
jgi:hypothetical protein